MEQWRDRLVDSFAHRLESLCNYCDTH